MTRWSVGIEAAGDVVMQREQIVELADAVAAVGGIASGIGEPRYGATLLVEARTREEAIDKAMGHFRDAAERAGLPEWPVTTVEATSEDEINPEDW
ncbi:MAG TPA: hypothetical protein VII47_12310 [Actinomycetota bacterium]|jgi:hypothetical protein